MKDFMIGAVAMSCFVVGLFFYGSGARQLTDSSFSFQFPFQLKVSIVSSSDSALLSMNTNPIFISFALSATS